MRRHLTLIVSGQVQGVFFRASAKAKADALGLKGTVRNLPDGNVQIEAEGPPEDLATFHAWCLQGPPRAIVEKVEVLSGELKNFEDFKVLR